MLNKMAAFMAEQNMLSPGDRVICGVSGGADSVAMLWAMFLLQEKLGIILEAAHFNHGLRGAESDRDEEFVREFCRGYQIPLTVQKGSVRKGPKGLEAAARDARYNFLEGLPGKIATAHNADDNGETLLMHLIRGTGLKGLGGIAPVRGKLIRPMLTVTRQEILEFLREYHLTYVEDSTNASEDFLRNRIRHQIMPVLRQENPSIGENLTRTALRLRMDEQVLERLTGESRSCSISELRTLEPAILSRVLSHLLLSWGVKEPEAVQVEQLKKLVFSDCPSAGADFRGGIRVSRVYDRLECTCSRQPPSPAEVAWEGVTELPEWGVRITCRAYDSQMKGIPLCPVGKMCIRSRQTGDGIRLSGGRKSLKKWFIDRKIPAKDRDFVPILGDDLGVLAVCGMGVSLDRQQNPTILAQIEMYTPA